MVSALYEPEQRRDYLSSLKALATILVVYVHSENIFQFADYTDLVPLRRAFSVFNAVAVPIFFLVSGYLLFSKPLEYKDSIAKKFHSLFVPFLIWNTIYFLLEIAVSMFFPEYCEPWDGTAIGLLKYYWGIPMGCALPIYAPLWFVRDLIILNMLSFVIKIVFDRLNHWLIALLLLVLWLSPVNDQARQSICFFCFGGLLGYGKSAFVCRKPMIAAALCGIIGLFISISSSNVYLIRIAIMLYVVAIMLFFSRGANIKKPLIKLMPYSFAIYVIHGKLLSIIQRLMVRIFPQTTLVIMLEYLFVPIAVIMGCILLAKILSYISLPLFSVATGNRLVSKKSTPN